MKIILIEIAVIAAVWLLIKILRPKIHFFKWGYTVRKASYRQDENMQVFIEDTHFLKDKKQNFRSMRVGGSNLIYSRIPLDPANGALMVYSYCAPMLALLKGSGTPIDRTLTLGGGGGAVPLYILQSYEKSTADIVEFNAESIRVSKAFFLKEYADGDAPRARFLHEDAREAVKTLQGPYGFIFCDLYVGGQPADLMYNKAFMEDVSRLAGEKGLLVINGGSFNMLGVRLVLQSLVATFAHAWAMMLGDGFVIAASNKPLAALDTLLAQGQGVIAIYPPAITEASLRQQDAPASARAAGDIGEYEP